MKQKKTVDFIVIDDDMLNNMISRKIIQLTAPGATINTFTDAAEGIKHIMQHYSNEASSNNAILFLNVNMPELSGWDVLDRLSNMPIKGKLNIYMLSSSSFEEDVKKAATYPLVSDYLDKPLSKSKMGKILKEYDLDT